MIVVFDLVGPLASYSLLRSEGMSAVAALVTSGILPAMGIAIGAWADRRLDVIGVMVLALTRPLFRLPAVVLGGLATLSTSAGLSWPKYLYLVLAAVATGAAVSNVFRNRSDATVVLALPMLIASAVLVIAIIASVVVVYSSGVPILYTLRDAASYLLFAAVPVLALDWSSDSTERQRVVFLTATSLLAALSYAVVWIARRHIGALPLTQVIEPSSLLACSLVAYACSGALVGHRMRRLWWFVAATVAALLISSGSRTVFLIGLAPVAIVISDHRRLGVRPLQFVAYLGATIVVCIGVAYVLFSILGRVPASG